MTWKLPFLRSLTIKPEKVSSNFEKFFRWNKNLKLHHLVLFLKMPKITVFLRLFTTILHFMMRADNHFFLSSIFGGLFESSMTMRTVYEQFCFNFAFFLLQKFSPPCVLPAESSFRDWRAKRQRREELYSIVCNVYGMCFDRYRSKLNICHCL